MELTQENFSLICELVIALLGLVPTFISLVLYIINVIKTKNWSFIVMVAQQVMTTVEKYSELHPDMTGKDKLDMALEMITNTCTAAGITVNDDLLEKVIVYIQEMCAWSKTVNKK